MMDQVCDFFSVCKAQNACAQQQNSTAGSFVSPLLRAVREANLTLDLVHVVLLGVALDIS